MAGTGKNRNEDIDSKIADFMADIDEIVLGKKSNTNSEQSEWQQCFDDKTQAVYYWNSKTNECSWEPPASLSPNNNDGANKIKRQQTSTDNKSPKKLKKPSIIAEYASSDSDSNEEENVDDIDELLNEVLEEKEKPVPVDRYPLFEADSRAAIARLVDLGDKTTDILTLRIQLETRLEDCLAGHLSKSYAFSKLEQALIQIDELEKIHLTPAPSLYVPEPSKPSLTNSDMALLLSLPPPPPPPSPPPPLTNIDDQNLQLFYAQLNGDQPDPVPTLSDTGKPTMVSKSEAHHHHHHHHKDKKSKPSKTLPTDLIQKWAHARQELHGGIIDIDDS